MDGICKRRESQTTWDEEREELKPCPFCGEQPTVTSKGDGTKRAQFTIKCMNPACYMTVETASYLTRRLTKEEAIAVWNKRNTEHMKPQTDVMTDASESALRKFAEWFNDNDHEYVACWWSKNDIFVALADYMAKGEHSENE